MLLNKCNISMVHFAFDFMKNEKKIIEGLQIFKKYFHGSDRNLKVYILTNYDTVHEEDWYRVRRMF